MYITRVELDVNKKNTQIALSSPSKIHGAIERAFAEKQSRNLWRIDKLGVRTYVLLVSAERPDMTNFIKQYGMENQTQETKKYDQLLDRIHPGSEWRFRLVANPSRCLQTEKGTQKRVAHISERYQMEWLLSKAEESGFIVQPEYSGVKSKEWKSFYKENNQSRVRFLQVTFEGKMIVKDAEKMRQALCHGIGREKAYGAGMLTIAKL